MNSYNPINFYNLLLRTHGPIIIDFLFVKNHSPMQHR